MLKTLKKFFCTIGAVIAGSSITACDITDISIEELKSAQAKAHTIADTLQIYEADGFKYEKTDGGINLIKYIGNEKNVVIPETIENQYVTAIKARCFLNEDNEDIINSVTVPSSIHEISPLAFYNSKFLQLINCEDNNRFLSDDGVLYTADMEYLIAYPMNKPDKEYKIPDTVSKIYNNAFSYCNNLESLKLSESIEAIPDYAFAYNSSIKEVVMPENVKEIGFAVFFNCPNLNKVVLPENGVEINDNAIIFCEQLKDVEYNTTN